MDEVDDYILLYRKSLDSAVRQSPEIWFVWTWCLLKATYKRRSVPVLTGVGRSQVDLLPGQFIYGRKSAAKELQLPESTVRLKMERLVALDAISMQSATHFTIVSICNWSRYQNSPEKNSHPPATHPPQTKNLNSTSSYSPNSSPSPTPKPRFGGEDLELAKWIWERVRALQPSRKTPNFEKWAGTVRLMRDRDGRTVGAIRTLFAWCNADPFWCTNVLSPEKLRAKWDDLELKRTRSNGHSATSNGHPARVRERNWDDADLEARTFRSAAAADDRGQRPDPAEAAEVDVRR